MNCKYNVFPKLIECRKRLLMSQRELAEIAGIPVETYKSMSEVNLSLDYPKCWQFKRR